MHTEAIYKFLKGGFLKNSTKRAILLSFISGTGAGAVFIKKRAINKIRIKEGTAKINVWPSNIANVFENISWLIAIPSVPAAAKIEINSDFLAVGSRLMMLAAEGWKAPDPKHVKR